MTDKPCPICRKPLSEHEGGLCPGMKYKVVKSLSFERGDKIAVQGVPVPPTGHGKEMCVCHTVEIAQAIADALNRRAPSAGEWTSEMPGEPKEAGWKTNQQCLIYNSAGCFLVGVLCEPMASSEKGWEVFVDKGFLSVADAFSHNCQIKILNPPIQPPDAGVVEPEGK